MASNSIDASLGLVSIWNSCHISTVVALSEENRMSQTLTGSEPIVISFPFV